MELDPEMSLALVTLVGLVLTFLFGWVARWLVKFLRETLKIRVTDSQAKGLEWGAKQAALATEQLFRKIVLNKPKLQVNAQKLQHAVQTTRSLAPAATANLSDEQVKAVVEAQVATMRASVPTPSMFPSAAAPEFMTIASSDGAVLYTRSVAPPDFSAASAQARAAAPIPRASHVPEFSPAADEVVTRPERGLKR
jgi:hypothetical protein